MRSDLIHKEPAKYSDFQLFVKSTLDSDELFNRQPGTTLENMLSWYRLSNIKKAIKKDGETDFYLTKVTLYLDGKLAEKYLFTWAVLASIRACKDQKLEKKKVQELLVLASNVLKNLDDDLREFIISCEKDQTHHNIYLQGNAILDESTTTLKDLLDEGLYEMLDIEAVCHITKNLVEVCPALFIISSFLPKLKFDVSKQKEADLLIDLIPVLWKSGVVNLQDCAIHDFFVANFTSLDLKKQLSILKFLDKMKKTNRLAMKKHYEKLKSLPRSSPALDYYLTKILLHVEYGDNRGFFETMSFWAKLFENWRKYITSVKKTTQ